MSARMSAASTSAVSPFVALASNSSAAALYWLQEFLPALSISPNGTAQPGGAEKQNEIKKIKK
jgi:hypothetical protein